VFIQLCNFVVKKTQKAFFWWDFSPNYKRKKKVCKEFSLDVWNILTEAYYSCLDTQRGGVTQFKKTPP
jgi:hypothetical protein